MTVFLGWQYQESPPTVQCAVEKALIRATKLQRKDLQLVGASRTDAGVHAWGQVRSCTSFCVQFQLSSGKHWIEIL